MELYGRTSVRRLFWSRNHHSPILVKKTTKRMIASTMKTRTVSKVLGGFFIILKKSPCGLGGAGAASTIRINRLLRYRLTVKVREYWRRARLTALCASVQCRIWIFVVRLDR